MATINLGYLMWDSSTGINCNCTENVPTDVINCGKDWNARGAQLIPKVDCVTGETTWILSDYLKTYPLGNGVRNGIAVTDPTTGVIYVWDISSGGATETIADKLQAMLSICNCFDCEGEEAIHTYGEYQCNYPAIADGNYCYNVTITNDGEPNSNGSRKLALVYNDFLVGYPFVISYNPANGTRVYRVCLNEDIDKVGRGAGQTWVLQP